MNSRSPQFPATGTNLPWGHDREAARLPNSGELPAACEVAIVGAGITGLTAALHLRATGRSVVVLDAGQPGDGTTGGSSAHLTTLPDSGLRRTETVFSTEANRHVTRAMRDAIGQIRHWVEAHNIECGYRSTDGHLFAEDAAGAQVVRDEAEAAARAGLEPRLRATLPLPFPVTAAFQLEQQAEFDPLAYARGLARAFASAGGILLTHTRVTDYREGRHVEVTTSRGSLRADQLILATHTPLGRSLLHAEMEPQRSYLIAATLEGEPPAGLYWDTATPYHYLRRIDRRGQPPLLLLGGEDHKTGTPISEDPYQRLLDWMRARFAVRRVEARWSAQYYAPADGFPYVGRPLTSLRVYVATGFNGDGLTLGTAAGGLLADLLQGRESELATLLAPTRVRPRALGRVVALNVEGAKHLVPREDTSPPEPGEGVVQIQNGATVAVSCSPSGEITTCSARCPHLGCIVQWNSAEKTWDCPCHGSRFDATGARLEGPTWSDLEPLPATPASSVPG